MLGLLSLQPAQAQKQYDVLDWKANVSLNTSLVQQMHQQYDGRRAALAQARQSEAGLRAYRDSARARFRRILGPMPAKTPLKARVTGQLPRDGYRIEKVVYESTPKHHVTANLYVPNGSRKKLPGVLLFCGHEAESKATESYQKTAILFAKNGFVVFVIDPISQGERYQLVDAAGKPLTRGGTTEHTLLNSESALLGTGSVADELWDNVRGLDYLLTRPEVDAARIGALGNSGGATQTAYFIGYDERVKVASLCSYVATGERVLELTGPSDGCVMIPGAGAARLDVADWPIMFAPQPLQILAGRFDFVDYNIIQETYAELRQVYTGLGQPEKVSLFTYDDGHGISQPKREAAVQWFRRWLYQDNQPVQEGSLATLKPEELWSIRTGQVSTAYKDEVLLPQRNLVRAAELARHRPKADAQHNLPALIREQLRLPAQLDAPVAVEWKGEVQTKGNVTLRKLIIRREGEVPLPALLALPAGEAPVTKVVLWLPERGKRTLADSTALLQSCLQQNCAVLLADLRGLGETADPEQFNDKKFYNSEYRNALLALHTGQPLLGQRVVDVFMALRFLAQTPRLQPAPVELYATGRAALVAQHAALLAPRISGVWLGPGTITSFTQVLAQPTAKDWYSLVLPGVLLRYDLPDLTTALEQQQRLIPGNK
ncbi:alpha/beta hydrolase family protein [Hymenobacter cellulosilyticus]|uniref:Alpha/beta hydrolase family protein n=1 Tax=Hymenobacter cellulosilyticus TaxID=2932248 RepID=A0A8T9QB03_9BACT|nr:acetylxylan esterase [Hymenobacter cellulosilyticus]UOQ74182.1 alpha/beta hydrolase family protein [Hymenobacter cellulosilyticus]